MGRRHMGCDLRVFAPIGYGAVFGSGWYSLVVVCTCCFAGFIAACNGPLIWCFGIPGLGLIAWSLYLLTGTSAVIILSAVGRDTASRRDSSYIWFLLRNLTRGGWRALFWAVSWVVVVVGFLVCFSSHDWGDGGDLIAFGFFALGRRCYAEMTTAITQGMQIEHGEIPSIFSLYLRSFFDDDTELDWELITLARTAFTSARFTEIIARAAWRYGPIVSAANPRNILKTGTLPTYFPDAEWQSSVKQLVGKAKHVLLVISFTSGLIEEFRTILLGSAKWKTVFVFPAEPPRLLFERWNDMTAGTELAASRVDVVCLTLVARFFRESSVVFVTALRRNHLSYKIAVEVGMLPLPLLEGAVNLSTKRVAIAVDEQAEITSSRAALRGVSGQPQRSAAIEEGLRRAEERQAQRTRMTFLVSSLLGFAVVALIAGTISSSLWGENWGYIAALWSAACFFYGWMVRDLGSGTPAVSSTKAFHKFEQPCRVAWVGLILLFIMGIMGIIIGVLKAQQFF